MEVGATVGFFDLVGFEVGTKVDGRIDMVGVTVGVIVGVTDEIMVGSPVG